MALFLMAYCSMNRTAASFIDFMPGICTWSSDREPTESGCDSASRWMAWPQGPRAASTSTLMGQGTVTEERLYQLIREGGKVAYQAFEIRFLDPGVRAYAFTFG
jgi:hypothetical protein